MHCFRKLTFVIYLAWPEGTIVKTIYQKRAGHRIWLATRLS